MGSVHVGVIDEDDQHTLEVLGAPDQQPSKHSDRTVRTNRSAMAFAFGA